VLLELGRREMAVMPPVRAVLFHYSAVNTGIICSVVSKGQRGKAVMKAVTAVLLHNCAMDTWSEFSVVSTG